MTLVAEPEHATAGNGEPLDPAHHDGVLCLDEQAAAELRQELALVTRALFVQLLPGTAERAIAGVPGLGGAAPAAAAPAEAAGQLQPAAPSHAPVDVVTPEADAIPAPAPVTPAALPLSVPLAPASQEAVATAPSPAVDEVPVLPSVPLALPVEVPEAPVPVAPEPSARKRADTRSMALLQEISFLDE